MRPGDAARPAGDNRDMPDTAELVAAAREAVYAAGRICKMIQSSKNALREIVKDDDSPVTVADFASQAIVAYILAERLGMRLSGPDALRLVGEETSAYLRNPQHGAQLAATLAAVQEFWPECDEQSLLDAVDCGAGDPDHAEFWTLDPIDGTKGFIRGGQYCVALAYIYHGEPIIAAMACPNLSRDFSRPPDEPDPHGTIYLAVRGGDSTTPFGLWELPGDDPKAEPLLIRRMEHADGDPITVCAPLDPGHADQEATNRIISRLGSVREPIRMDSQCKYAVVGRGQADAYIRLPRRRDYVERIWDHAAGTLIAMEGGCLVSDASGAPLDFGQGRGLEKNRGIVVAPPRLHGRIVEEIRREGVGG